ncbi:MAG: RNA methyltransferase [Corynebacterium sp.]|nr:RNA methyltransferase [Corynebacterium sp.]
MEPILITDPQDSRLDDFRDLKHSDAADRRLVIAESPLGVERLMESRFPTRAIVGFGGRLASFLETHEIPESIPVYEVTREVLAEVAGFDMHRGLVASADRAEELSIAEILETAKTLCVLEGVGDHENIGSIFRNAAGLSVDAVLFGAGCADPLYRRSVRVSMGHALRLPFAHFPGKRTNWQHGLERLRDAGFRIISMTPNPEAMTLREAMADNPEKVAFLIGAEGPGLTEHAMRATDMRVRIPMAPGTDSLNLATAAAIAFYERLSV